MSLSPIQVNNADLPIQPSNLREWREYIQTEQTAIDGAIQRNRVRTPHNPNGFKYNVEMTFERISSTIFSQIDALFVSGSGVVYNNPTSKYGSLTFSGLPYPEEGDDYEAGDSLLSDYKVTIRQF